MTRLKRNARFSSSRQFRAALFGACCAAVIGGPASAAVITNNTPVNFTGGSVSFGYGGDSDFTFSDVSGGFFSFEPVGVSTSGGGAVTALGAPFYSQPTPSTFFDPVRGSGVLEFGPGSGYQFQAFPSTTTIPYSASPFIIGLADVTAGGTHYGYAAFDGTVLESYAFQSVAGVGILTPVPLPTSAPMFGVALLALGAAGYGLKWNRKDAAA